MRLAAYGEFTRLGLYLAANLLFLCNHRTADKVGKGQRMPSRTKVVRLDREAADIWSIISNVGSPETWTPFLHSRKRSNDEGEEWSCFPYESANICPDRIILNVIAHLPADRAVVHSPISSWSKSAGRTKAVNDTEGAVRLKIAPEALIMVSRVLKQHVWTHIARK